MQYIVRYARKSESERNLHFSQNTDILKIDSSARTLEIWRIDLYDIMYEMW